MATLRGLFATLWSFLWSIVEEISSFVIPLLPHVHLAPVDRKGGVYLPETVDREDFLYTKTWAPEGRPRVVVVAVHGLGEHINRYDHVFTRFAENGIKTVGVDLHGFGRSTGRRGAPHSFEQIFAAISLVREYAREDGLKTILFGHSMGGLVVLSYISEQSRYFDGVIASAPAIDVATKVPEIKNLAAKWLGTIPIVNQITIPNGLPLAGLSRDPQVIHDYKRDPLVHDKISIELGASLISHGQKLRSGGGKKIAIPILIAHGTADILTSFPASEAFINTVSSPDHKFIPYEGLFHELHNEPEKDRVIQQYIDWILQHARP